jgi:hypothetical protein
MGIGRKDVDGEPRRERHEPLRDPRQELTIDRERSVEVEHEVLEP